MEFIELYVNELISTGTTSTANPLMKKDIINYINEKMPDKKVFATMDDNFQYTLILIDKPEAELEI